jgi:hypothetical protein
MKAVWQGRLSQTAATYSEHAPMATACCNTCRSCVQTNAISLALAAIVTTGAGVKRFGRRHFGRHS